MRYFKNLTIFGVLAFCLCPSTSYAETAAKAPSLVKIVRPFRLHLPIDCKVGTDCWVLNYPDVGAPDDGQATDPACGPRTYDGHKGTDIAIPDITAMDKGVAVRAAAAGTVTRVRNAEEDHFPLTDEQRAQIETDKKECGNAVLIDHGQGWQTMYCHMRKGSVVVKAGQKIAVGEKIGLVGASGLTEFPHIHLGVIHNQDPVDPFAGLALSKPCGGKSATLFEKSSGLSYQPFVFMKTGFADEPVTLGGLDRGDTLPEPNTKAKALVFYTVVLGTREGDEISLRIEGPEGKIFAERTTKADKNSARTLTFVGRKTSGGAAVTSGTYRGIVTVKRKGADGQEETYRDERAILVKEAQ